LPVDYPAPQPPAAPRPHAHAPLSMKANFSWTLAGNIAYAACQWAMLVVLAKLGTPEKVGQFVLGLAVTAPVMLFSSLKLRSVQATDARGDFHFGDYFALRLLCTGVAAAVVAGVALFGGYSRDTALVVLAVGAAKSLESISDILQGLFQQHERMDWIARSLAIKGVLSLAALATVFYLTRSVVFASVAMAAAFAAVLLGFDLPVSGRLLRANAAGTRASLLRPRWHPTTLKALLILTLPLGVAVAATSLATNIPRYFVASALGESALGIFGALASPLAAGVLIINALAQSAAPRLAKYHAAGQSDAFDRTLKKLVTVGFLLGAAGLAFALVAGRQVLLILFKPEYARHFDVFLWMVAAAALQYAYVFLGSAINAMRFFRIQLPMNLVNPTIAVIACALLVPSFGLKGAAWGMFVAVVCEGLTYLVAFLTVRSRRATA
jgi:O-antigen/teichoic acid export membrane protein